MTVLVLGDVMVDVVARHGAPLAAHSDTPARVALRPGGAGGNVAAWLARAGARVSLLARVGEDAAAGIALSALEGVDVRAVVDPERRTGVCVVLVDAAGERTMLPDAGANDGLRAEELPELPDVLYVSGYTLLRSASRTAARAALDRARGRGARVVVDAASAAPLRDAPGFRDWAGPLDLLLANADEAQVLGDARRLAREVVVKRGGAGAAWFGEGGRVEVPAVPARMSDTVGAGDAFAAGFLSVWPAGAPQEALARAAELAAEAVATEGGRPRL